MNLELRNTNNKPVYYSPIVSIAFVVGTRKDIDKIKKSINVTIRRKHFFPRIGWELKDVVIIGLPQEFRFLVLKDFESRELANMGYFILFCSK